MAGALEGDIFIGPKAEVCVEKLINLSLFLILVNKFLHDIISLKNQRFMEKKYCDCPWENHYTVFDRVSAHPPVVINIVKVLGRALTRALALAR